MRSTSLRCLRTGHSHEDIDGCFASLGRFMARQGKQARHTGDFVQLVTQWLQGLPRPYEPKRFCVKLDQFRDWMLESESNKNYYSGKSELVSVSIFSN